MLPQRRILFLHHGAVLPQRRILFLHHSLTFLDQLLPPPPLVFQQVPSPTKLSRPLLPRQHGFRGFGVPRSGTGLRQHGLIHLLNILGVVVSLAPDKSVWFEPSEQSRLLKDTPETPP